MWDLKEGKEISNFSCVSRHDIKYWTKNCAFSLDPEDSSVVLHTTVVPVTWKKMSQCYLVRRSTADWGVEKRVMIKDRLSAMSVRFVGCYSYMPSSCSLCECLCL